MSWNGIRQVSSVLSSSLSGRVTKDASEALNSTQVCLALLLHCLAK
jgi:hypothetical protein